MNSMSIIGTNLETTHSMRFLIKEQKDHNQVIH
jgi:hypothetical protein